MPIQNHPTIVLPIIYDIANQMTQIADKRDGTTSGSILQTAMVLLKNSLERRGMPTTESSLVAAIQDLLINLPYPGQNPGPNQMQGNPMQGGPMQGNPMQGNPMQGMSGQYQPPNPQQNPMGVQPGMGHMNPGQPVMNPAMGGMNPGQPINPMNQMNQMQGNPMQGMPNQPMNPGMNFGMGPNEGNN
jgi:hypothetical protein